MEIGRRTVILGAAAVGVGIGYKLGHQPDPAFATVASLGCGGTTRFSAYAGPIIKDNWETRTILAARVAAAFGVSVLPAERLFSETSYGKAITSASPVVMSSYKQVTGLAANNPTVVNAVTAEIQAMKAHPEKTFFVACDHEVDNKIKNGSYSVTTYKAAASRFASIVRSVNAANVSVAVCYMGWTFTQPTGSFFHPERYFDPATCDVIALDPYWTSNLKTVESVMDPGYLWASSKGKPVHVWETGFYTSGSQTLYPEATYTSHVADVIGYWNDKADWTLWFEANKSDGNNLLEGHPQAQAEWAAAVQG